MKNLILLTLAAANFVFHRSVMCFDREPLRVHAFDSNRAQSAFAMGRDKTIIVGTFFSIIASPAGPRGVALSLGCLGSLCIHSCYAKSKRDLTGERYKREIERQGKYEPSCYDRPCKYGYAWEYENAGTVTGGLLCLGAAATILSLKRLKAIRPQ